MSTELFRQIEEANTRMKDWGWCDLYKANALASMVLALRPKIIVEVGVYGGRSLQAFAQALKSLGSGIVIGIDPWDKAASVADMADQANINWWSGLDHESVYQKCMDNIRLLGIDSFVQIIRAKSDDVDPKQWTLDVAHIDGSHEETAYRDTVRYGSQVRVGGILVADDTQWSSGAPQRGVEWMLANGFIQLYPLGTGAVFQRVK